VISEDVQILASLNLLSLLLREQRSNSTRQFAFEQKIQKTTELAVGWWELARTDNMHTSNFLKDTTHVTRMQAQNWFGNIALTSMMNHWILPKWNVVWSHPACCFCFAFAICN